MVQEKVTFSSAFEDEVVEIDPENGPVLWTGPVAQVKLLKSLQSRFCASKQKVFGAYGNNNTHIIHRYVHTVNIM